MFYQQEELARTEERKTDAILEGEPKKDSNVAAKSQEECIEETVTMCKYYYCIYQDLFKIHVYTSCSFTDLCNIDVKLSILLYTHAFKNKSHLLLEFCTFLYIRYFSLFGRSEAIFKKYKYLIHYFLRFAKYEIMI